MTALEWKALHSRGQRGGSASLLLLMRYNTLQLRLPCSPPARPPHTLPAAHLAAGPTAAGPGVNQAS